MIYIIYRQLNSEFKTLRIKYFIKGENLKMKKKTEYKCVVCGSINTVRENIMDSKCPNDYWVECLDCGNWEQSNNNKLRSFKACRPAIRK